MLWLTVTLTLLSSLPSAPPEATQSDRVRINKVWIALSTDNGKASDAVRHVRAGTKVTAWLVVEATINWRRRVFTQAPRLWKGRREVRRIERWPDALGQPRIRFMRLEADPKGGIYDNTGKLEVWWHPERQETHPPGWHWCPIDYAETDTGWGSVWSKQVTSRPTTTPDRYDGLGTMRFAAQLDYRGKSYRSKGLEHRDKAGLKRGVATLQVRMDDTPVGYMTELINVPYVYGSHTPTGRIADHQAERAVGADCADLIVYGWRRAGRRINYTWTQGLKKLTRIRAVAATVSQGFYRKADGSPIAFGKDVRVSDILLWGRHVAAIAKRDPSGFLTPDTQILHTITGSPAMGPLKEIGFGFDSMSFEVRRPKWTR